MSVAELSTESQKWGCLSSVATDLSLSLEEWGADSLSPRCPPWPFTPLLLQQLWHMYSPAERFPGPEAPALTGSATPGLPCPDSQIAPSFPWELKEKELKGLGVRRPEFKGWVLPESVMGPWTSLSPSLGPQFPEL